MNKPTFLQKFRNNPHNLLLITGIFLLSLSFLTKNENNAIDVHLHDTYFVINLTYFYWFLAIVASVMWALYIPVKKYLYSSNLTQIHVIVSATIIFFMALTLTYNPRDLRPRRYIDYSSWHKWYDFSAHDQLLIIALLATQVLFFANIAGGLFKRKG